MEVTRILRNGRGDISKTIKREVSDSFTALIPRIAAGAPDGPALLTLHIAVLVRDEVIIEAGIPNRINAVGLPASQLEDLRRSGNVSVLQPVP